VSYFQVNTDTPFKLILAFLANIRIGWKVLPMMNALAYLASWSVMKKKGLYHKLLVSMVNLFSPSQTLQ
jgi:hypothetical protein